jgi:twitching motility two-component system response regulator PilH
MDASRSALIVMVNDTPRSGDINMATILVIDDSLTEREYLKEILESTGFQVLTAINGEEALNTLKTNQPDIIFLDIVMPQMNGYEVCRKIKENPKTKSVPIIICSAKSEEFDRYWGMKQGADAYITKPFRPKELLQTMKTLIKQD